MLGTIPQITRVPSLPSPRLREAAHPMLFSEGTSLNKFEYMTKDKQTLGQLGEKLALKYLEKEGYEILDRNFRTRAGELDIVAKDGGILVFVEVKTRSSRAFGLPQEAVDFRKQNKIIRMALEYMREKRVYGTWRVDVVAVEMDQSRKLKNIELIRNAVIR